ncbi:hypothetical protein TNCV_686861 [Trichonephila clavipes]|nr:hypothetical protein TNCV_686861 [Trichonephila clavipes]
MISHLVSLLLDEYAVRGSLMLMITSSWMAYHKFESLKTFHIIQCERVFRDKVSGAREWAAFKSVPLLAIDRDSVPFLATLRLPIGTLKGVHSCRRR